MAHYRAITLSAADLQGAMPKLRLLLTEKSKELGKNIKIRRVPSCCVNKITNWLQHVVKGAENDMRLVYGYDPVQTEKNKEKLKTYFSKMKESLNAQEAELLIEMEKMTPDQQNQLLIFWESVHIFFLDVIEWIRKTFDFVLEKIKAGYKLIKDAVKEFFETILDLFKNIF